jgi:hypothetical protein
VHVRPDRVTGDVTNLKVRASARAREIRAREIEAREI